MSGKMLLWIEKIGLFILNEDSCLIYYCDYSNIRHPHYRFIVIRFLASWLNIEYLLMLMDIIVRIGYSFKQMVHYTVGEG